ncbi:MAG: ABC transporter ATP-binding protein [Chloroflexi bacterium]|nr:ABC transporter ATP-binding protein [Chloroflexota bacterium]
MSQPVIVTEEITKDYSRLRALDRVSFAVNQGEIFGFLGPNGAGKTTAIRLFLDFIRPTSGRAMIFGLDCQRDSLAIRRRVVYLPGDVSFYEGLTGGQYLRYMLGFRPKWHQGKEAELAERLDLDPSRTIRGYSRGMKQKLAVMLVLLADADLLILDEPTLGLDPLMQQEVYALLREEQSEGRTIFFSSHNLPEVARTCDRAGILRQGELVAIEDVAGLRRVRTRQYYVTFDNDHIPQGLGTPAARELERRGRQVGYAVTGEVGSFLQALSQYRVLDVEERETTLEEIFMRFYEPGSQ